MATSWRNAWAWLPQCFGRERSLDAIVAEARRQTFVAQEIDSPSLRAEAQRLMARPADSAHVARALALFAEAVRQAVGWTLYDVQLRAAAAMTLGLAVEMRTGEGKTPAVGAAAAALALQRRHVHVATVNAYLAGRDFAFLQPVFQRLGIAVGLLPDQAEAREKQKVYESCVVYGAGYTFGFDFLREQLRQLRQHSERPGMRLKRRFTGETTDLSYQPKLDCAIVDELDSVLLDEAGVPLILNEQSGVHVVDAPVTAAAAETIKRMTYGRHYLVSSSERRAILTPLGEFHIGDSPSPELRRLLCRPWRLYVEDALTAAHLLRRDVDYVVLDGKIWIVDATTGRIFADRRWAEGLQRAVEFRENVSFSPPTAGAARITRQKFYQLYARLSGTSGTLSEARDELAESYRLRLAVVPPRVPLQFAELAALCFPDAETRDRAALAEATAMQRSGRPVLIGCRTIDVSRRLSAMLRERGTEHQVLNGTQSADEAQIVSQAGQAGRLLIATNLAGRGTDIRLSDEARHAGGLHVIGVECHESKRIDRQLLGRAGRQGDPGSGRFFLSADDSLWLPYTQLRRRIQRESGPSGEVSLSLAAEIASCRVDVERTARRRRKEVGLQNNRIDDVVAKLGVSK